MVFYFFALIGFWASLVFYNSYLPDIANENQQDITSAKGYSMGYLGSIILLIICLFLTQFPSFFLIANKTEAVKLSFVLVGIWWFVFSHYTFHYLPGKEHYNTKKTSLFSRKTLFSGIRQLMDVLKQLKANYNLKVFLFSFFIFTIPTQTIILLASYFGADMNEINWPSQESMQTGLIIAIIVIQILAALGAFLAAKLSTYFGNVKTLILINIIWCLICLFGYFVTEPIEFYIAAAFIGVGMGACGRAWARVGVLRAGAS